MLLTQVLVAFTVEFDNEFRAPVPHRTGAGQSSGGPAGRPRLVSQVDVGQGRQYVERHALRVADPAAHRGKVVRPTAKGQAARARHGRTLTDTEERWWARYGSEALATLRRTLEALRRQRRPVYASVTAPRSAPVTSRAYLASTPVV